MSQKRAVTSRRSSWTFRRSASGAVGGDAGEETGARVVDSGRRALDRGAPTGVPQSAQNFFPGISSDPHSTQAAGSGAPQSAQNRLPAGDTSPQRAHVKTAIVP